MGHSGSFRVVLGRFRSFLAIFMPSLKTPLYVCDWGYSMEVESFAMKCGEDADGAVRWVGGEGDKFDCKRNRPTMAGWRRRYE